MPFTFPTGELALLEGFRALRVEYGRTLNVLSDPNNPINTKDNTTVGTSFVAVLTPAAETDLQTMLGNDIRFDAWAEVDKSDDPEVEETARLSDGATTYKVVKYDRSASSGTNRYFLVQIEDADQ